MRYSLLGRFQGALLGSWIGESLGRHYAESQCTDFQGVNRTADFQLSPWSQITLCAAESLLDCKGFDGHSWSAKVANCSPTLLKGEQSGNNGGTALATLPLALFFHQNWGLLRDYLLKAASVWQIPAADSDALLVYGWAIALALRENLTAEKPIAQRFPLLAAKLPNSRYLAQVQEMLATSPSLEMASASWNRPEQLQSAIALALLCCDETPEDLPLCIKRAVRANHQPAITGALAGALAGAYNALGGIPLDWRLWMQPTQTSQRFTRRAEQLFAAWCGVYQPDQIAKRWQRVTVTAPKLIQPRASLKIISQKE